MKKKIKLGLYGCGSRTRDLLDSVRGKNEYEVVSAYDIREESTKSLCEKFGGKICHSAEEMLDCKDIDAVLISLDPFAHPRAFEESLRIGKPIFIEKPIAPTAQEAYRMMQAAAARKVPVQVGLIYRYTPVSRAVREYLDQHDPGRIFAIAARWFQTVEVEVINHHQKQLSSPNNFRLRISQIPYHACHMLDLFRFLNGEITSVQAVGVKYKEWRYVSPDEVIAIFTCANGAIGQFHYSGFCYGQPDGSMPLCIHAQNYTIEFCQWNRFIVWSRPATPAERGEEVPGDCRPTWNQHIGPVCFEPKGTSYTEQTMTDFLESVRTGAPMKVPIEDGYKVAEIAEAIERSYKTGRRVELPLQFDSEI